MFLKTETFQKSWKFYHHEMVRVVHGILFIMSGLIQATTRGGTVDKTKLKFGATTPRPNQPHASH